MGAIDLASSVIPVGAQDSTIDIKTRQRLFREGLDYRHGKFRVVKKSLIEN